MCRMSEKLFKNIPVVTFLTPQCETGDSWTHAAAKLTCSKQTSVCPQQTKRMFQHLLSKIHTCLPLPPLKQTWALCLLAPTLLLTTPSFTSLFDLTVTKLKQHLGSFWFGIEFSDTTNHKVRGYKYRSKSEFLFHEADPEGCGFYPWLVIAADLSGPKWVEATATWNCTTLHFTLSYNLCGIIALWVLK